MNDTTTCSAAGSGRLRERALQRAAARRAIALHCAALGGGPGSPFEGCLTHTERSFGQGRPVGAAHRAGRGHAVEPFRSLRDRVAPVWPFGRVTSFRPLRRVIGDGQTAVAGGDGFPVGTRWQWTGHTPGYGSEPCVQGKQHILYAGTAGHAPSSSRELSIAYCVSGDYAPGSPRRHRARGPV